MKIDHLHILNMLLLLFDSKTTFTLRICNHEIRSTWTPAGHYQRQTTLGITRSNITFVGTGKDTTTVLGGFGIENQQQLI